MYKRQVVHFLDFGSIKRYKQNEWVAWQKIIGAVLTGDLNLLEKGFASLDSLPERYDRNMARAYFKVFTQGVMKTISQDEICSVDPQLVANDLRHMMLDPFFRKNGSLPASAIMQLRNFYGFWGTIAQLGSRANWRQLLVTTLFETNYAGEVAVEISNPTL